MDPGTIIAGVTGVLGAFGAMQSGQAQAAAFERNAQIDKENAGQAAFAAEADASRQQTAMRRRMATARNAAAASGVDIASGSPLDVMADIAAESALDVAVTRWRGRQRSNAYLTQAGNDMASADQAEAAGIFGAGTTLLTGAGRAYGSFTSSRSSAGNSTIPSTGGSPLPGGSGLAWG